MKKLISILFLCFCTTVCYAQTAEVSCNIIEQNDMWYPEFNYKNSTLRASVSYIDNIWWTGKEYIWQKLGKYKESADLNTWEDMNVSEAVSNIYMYQMVSYFWGNKYILFDCHFKRPGAILSSIERGTGQYYSALRVLDENYEMIKEISFELPITDVGYTNGVYYLRTQDYLPNYETDKQPVNVIYKSGDALNWEAVPGLEEIPLSNGKRNILTFGKGRVEREGSVDYYFLGDMSVADASAVNPSLEGTSVAFEQQPYRYYQCVDDFYISYESSKTDSFEISMDGVYWMEIKYPEKENGKKMREVLVMDDKLLFHGWDTVSESDKLYEYDIQELKDALQNRWTEDAPYVKVNSSILGFEEQPVIEDGRTLVPMRFLFEQMGADVDWDQDTQTATAKLHNTAVTFSIDNTRAAVNNTPVTMEVPARMVEGKTMVPLRFLSEEMGYSVVWDDNSRVATIE